MRQQSIPGPKDPIISPPPERLARRALRGLGAHSPHQNGSFHPLISTKRPQGDYENIENPEYVTSINSNGDVVGSIVNHGFEGYEMDVFVLPFGATAGTILPRLHQRIIEEGDSTYANYIAPRIANDGRIFSFYSGNNQDGELVQCGVVWAAGTPAQYGGKVSMSAGNSGSSGYTISQSGPLIIPESVNENGSSAGEYAQDLDQDLEFQERGSGIWTGTLFKADTNHNRSSMEDITIDGHVLGYINFGTSFYSGIWVSNNGTFTPRENLAYIRKINNHMLGINDTNLWRNDRLIPVAALENRPNFKINYLYDINNKGVLLCNVTDNQINKNAILVPVEILKPRMDNEGNETGKFKGVDSLKVAQWEKAWRTDATPYGELVDDFLDKDPDRFYVRVPIVGSAESMSVKMSTVDSAGNTIDDWQEIEMEVEPENSGMLKSKSHILVADTPDKTAAGISDNSEITHRLHKVALLGKVKFQIQIGTAIAEIDLPVPGADNFKTVTINAVILREVPGGAPAASEAYVWNDLVNNVKSAYAQANTNISIGNVTVADPPPGVDLADGLALAEPNNIPQEVKALVDALGTASPDDIHIFYVDFITRPLGAAGGGKGFALPDRYFPNTLDRPYIYNAFVGMDEMNYLTTSHELGHLLTNHEHIETPVEVSSEGNARLAKDQHNLMFGGTILNRLWDGTIQDSKRLWNDQIKEIRKNPHAK